MTPDSLAALSDSLFSVAVGVYSLALVAFCAQLAFGRRPARQLVAAGGPDAAPLGTPVAARPEPVRRWGAIGLGLTVLGALAHAGVLVARGLATDRLPFGNLYEFITAALLVGVVAYLALAVRTPALRRIGLFVVGPVVLALVGTGLGLYTEAGPVIAALRSSWLGVHVTTAILGSGVFLVSGIASLLYLLRSRADARGSASRLPSAAALDRVAHRTAVFGFPVWTFAVIAGAIWAESAWGRFWGWDPKETWAFIAWIVYAAYLHARTTSGWRGRPAAWINVVGLGVMLFNTFYVNFVSTGLHSYAQ